VLVKRGTAELSCCSATFVVPQWKTAAVTGRFHCSHLQDNAEEIEPFASWGAASQLTGTALRRGEANCALVIAAVQLAHNSGKLRRRQVQVAALLTAKRTVKDGQRVGVRVRRHSFVLKAALTTPGHGSEAEWRNAGQPALGRPGSHLPHHNREHRSAFVRLRLRFIEGGFGYIFWHNRQRQAENYGQQEDESGGGFPRAHLPVSVFNTKWGILSVTCVSA